jgi:thiamine-phosphate pyrophosphorylase
MRRRQPLPAIWLMTDERMGDALWSALERVPRGGGVVFRHYRSADRRALFDRVRAVCRRRRLVLLLGGPPALAVAWKADGAHGPSPHRRTARPLVRSRPAHSRRELVAGRPADLRFVSPLFATRSHPGAPALGIVRAGLMIRGETATLIALGGVKVTKVTGLRGIGFDGWAGIDVFSVG